MLEFLWQNLNIYIRILSRRGSWEMAPKRRSEAQVSCLQLLGFFYNCTAAHFYLERSFHFAIPGESQFSRRLKKINLKPEQKSNSKMLKIKNNIPLRFSNFIILNCGTVEKGSPSWTLETWFVLCNAHIVTLYIKYIKPS